MVKDSPEDVDVLLTAELRRRGLSDAEIKAATRKKKRRKALEFAAVTYPVHGLRLSSARTPDELCTVEFAAGQLKLHPKTILRFIKESRLRATRVGKSYRILRSDLDAFSGVPAPAETPAEEAWVTSIVDVPGVAPDLARRWATTVTGALDARPRDGQPLRAEVIYETERAHLKIVVVGSVGDTAGLMALIKVWLEQLRP